MEEPEYWNDEFVSDWQRWLTGMLPEEVERNLIERIGREVEEAYQEGKHFEEE